MNIKLVEAVKEKYKTRHSLEVIPMYKLYETLAEIEKLINEQIERECIEYAMEILSSVAIKFEDYSDGWNKIKDASVELRKKLHALGITPKDTVKGGGG